MSLIDGDSSINKSKYAESVLSSVSPVREIGEEIKEGHEKDIVLMKSIYETEKSFKDMTTSRS
jgi:hypothetical protein